MKTFQVLTLILTFAACKPAPNELAYDLASGNKVLLRAIKESDTELANKQAIYLASNYGKDGLASLAPDVLVFLKEKNLNIDSLVFIEEARMKKIRDYAEPDPYEKIHIAFEGMPEISELKPMLEDVMKRSNMEINNDNILKCANVLVVLRQNSKIGITEMQILKHMYQNGSSNMDYATQSAMSSLILEKTK